MWNDVRTNSTDAGVATRGTFVLVPSVLDASYLINIIHRHLSALIFVVIQVVPL